MKQKQQSLRYKPMLDYLIKQKEDQKTKVAKKVINNQLISLYQRYKKVSAHNLDKGQIMNLIYSKESLQILNQTQNKPFCQIKGIIHLQIDQEHQQFKIIQKNDKNNNDDKNELNEKIEKNEKNVKLFNSECYCEFNPALVITSEGENANVSAVFLFYLLKTKIWNKISFQPNTLIIVHGSPHTGKKKLLCTNSKDNLGILEQSVIHMLGFIQNNKEGIFELVISVVGFVSDKIIDLLNMDQDFTTLLRRNLKIKKEEKGLINTQNLIQMGIRNIEEFYSILGLNQSLKSILGEYIDQKIDTIVYQLAIANMNSQRTKIDKISQKINIIKISNTPNTHTNTFALAQCLNYLVKGSEDIRFMPSKNTKFTFYIDDCLRSNQNIYYIINLNQKIPLNDQIQTVKLLNSFSQQKVIVKKNFVNDEQILQKVYEEDYILVKSLIKDLESKQNESKNINELKKEQLLDGELNMQIHLPRIYGHTKCFRLFNCIFQKGSIQKRKNRSMTVEVQQNSQFN